MPHRYREPRLAGTLGKLRLFAALRQSLRSGYDLRDLRSDLLAGTIVAMVAIPLAMALAIASGVAPEAGLYTVIVAGSLVALIGGSKLQVTGPTAAFVVILAPIAQRHGLAGLLTAGVMAGLILVFFGAARLGRLIQFIPHPVTTGFTAGIAVAIAATQLRDFFGIALTKVPEHFFAKLGALISARDTFSPLELGIGLTTLAFIALWTKFNKKIPAPFVALTVMTGAAALLTHFRPDLSIATIGSRFGGIPRELPSFSVPWPELSIDYIQGLLPSAFVIAILGAIESLLSAVVADSMGRTKHDPDGELIALGIGNIVCPFFGGIAATGAVARTTTNIRYGAKSPFASFFHAIVTLTVVLVFAPFVSYLPMASLAALLLVVAWHMSQFKHFTHIVRVAPRSDTLVLLLCFGLTVVFDMVIGVSIGIVLAALLFMRRMAEITSFKEVKGEETSARGAPPPKEIMVYEVGGPLFFGAAERAIEAVGQVTDQVKFVVFVMNDVPIMDISGLVAFESAIDRLTSGKREVLLVGLNEQPQLLLKRAGLPQKNKHVRVYERLSEAIKAAKDSLAGA